MRMTLSVRLLRSPILLPAKIDLTLGQTTASISSLCLPGGFGSKCLAQQQTFDVTAGLGCVSRGPRANREHHCSEPQLA